MSELKILPVVDAPASAVLNIGEAVKLAYELFHAQNFVGALQVATGITTADATLSDGWELRGLCCAELQRWRDALEFYDKSAALVRSALMRLSINRGRALAETGETAEALKMFDAGVRAGSVAALVNRGVLRMHLDQFEDAVLDFDMALRADPENQLAHYSRGFAMLTLGVYEQGFAGYEARDRKYFNVEGAPLWTGESLDDRVLLVHGEQGYGDTIMFARYLTALTGMARGVVVTVSPEVRPLLDIPGVTVLGDDVSAWPEINAWVPLMSLAHRLGTTIDTVPEPLKIPLSEQRRGYWQLRLDRERAPYRTRVGICWSGSTLNTHDKHRTLPLEALARMLKTLSAHMRFFSLQKGVRETDRALLDELVAGGVVDNLEPLLTDFRETAHAIAELDVVVTCCTSIAHLAGSLGKPTVLMLSKVRPFWVWGRGEDPSPWYPSIEIVRQRVPDDWRDVADRVAGELLLRL